MGYPASPCVTALAILGLALTVAHHGHASPAVRVQSYSSGDIVSSITQFPCQSKDIRWTGVAGVDMVMLCNNDHVYCSHNYGRSWKWITDHLFSSSSRGLIVGIDAINASSYVLLRSDNATYVYDLSVDSLLGQVQVIYDRHQPQPPPKWLNLDSTLRSQSMTFDLVVPHPRNANRAFAMKLDPDCDAYGSNKALQCHVFIFITGVLGLSSYQQWKMVTQVDHLWLSAEWGTNPADLSELYVVRRMQESTLKSGHLLRLHIDQPAAFGAQSLSSVTTVLDGALLVDRLGDWLFVAAFASAHVGLSLVVSSSDLQNPTWAEFPTKTRTGADITGVEIGYAVVDAKDEIFINVYHSVMSVGSALFARQWGTTYVSGLNGSRFTPSLEFNRRKMGTGSTGDGSVDFHRVAGLDGIIIANRVQNPDDALCARCTFPTECDANCMYETVITRDNGKTWQLLTPPAGLCVGSDSSDNFGDCSLHLHGSSSLDGDYDVDVKALLSSPSAPGLIIANGNVGSELSMEGNGPRSVYFSRDGGETWQLLADGRHMYGETDFGGVLYLAPVGVPTTYLNYSGDVGRHWTSEQVVPEPIIFTDFTRPKHRPAARHVTMVGQDETSGNTNIIFVDLSGIKDATCTDDDFEDFTPASYFSESAEEKCLLGRRITYRRKRMGRECWVLQPPHPAGTPFPDFAYPAAVTPCSCTRDDYECDWFYYEAGPEVGTSKDSSDATCITAYSHPEAVAQARCSDGAHTTYFQSVGYRLIGGDGCVGGLNLNPVELPCPNQDNGLSGGAKAFIVLLIVVAALAALRVLYVKNEFFRDVVDQARVAGSSLWGGAFSGRTYRHLPTDDTDEASRAAGGPDDTRSEPGSDEDETQPSIRAPKPSGTKQPATEQQPRPATATAPTNRSHPLQSNDSDLIEVEP